MSSTETSNPQNLAEILTVRGRPLGAVAAGIVQQTTL